jgi:hypothetical protein
MVKASFQSVLSHIILPDLNAAGRGPAKAKNAKKSALQDIVALRLGKSASTV